MSNPPAGWYPDPTGQPNTIRWWNGTQWTNRTEQEPADEAGSTAESTETPTTEANPQPVTTANQPSATPQMWNATQSGPTHASGAAESAATAQESWGGVRTIEPEQQIAAVQSAGGEAAGDGKQGLAEDGLSAFERARATWGAPAIAPAPPEHWTQQEVPDEPSDVPQQTQPNQPNGWKLTLAPSPVETEPTEGTTDAGETQVGSEAAGAQESEWQSWSDVSWTQQPTAAQTPTQSSAATGKKQAAEERWGVQQEPGEPTEIQPAWDAHQDQATAQQPWGGQQPSEIEQSWGQQSAPDQTQSQQNWGTQPGQEQAAGQQAWGEQSGDEQAEGQQGWGEQQAGDQPTQVQQAWGVQPDQEQAQGQQGWGDQQAGDAADQGQQGWATEQAGGQADQPQQGWGAEQAGESADHGQRGWGVQADHDQQGGGAGQDAAQGDGGWGLEQAPANPWQSAGDQLSSTDGSNGPGQQNANDAWGGGQQTATEGWGVSQQNPSEAWAGAQQTAHDAAGGGQQNSHGAWGGGQQTAAEAWGGGPQGGSDDGRRGGKGQKKNSGGGGSGAKVPLIVAGAVVFVMLIVAAVFLITNGDDKQAGPDNTTTPTNQPTTQPTGQGSTKPGQSKNPKLHEGDARISSDAISFPRRQPPWSDRKRLVRQLNNSSGQYVLLQEKFDGRNNWYADIYVGALGTESGFNGDPKATALSLSVQLRSSMYGDIPVTFKTVANGAVKRTDKSGWFVQQTVTAKSAKVTARVLTLTVAVFDLGDGTAVAYISDIPTNRPDLRTAESLAYKGINVG
jgi:hypothetical protein